MLKNLLLVVASTLASFALLEGALRVIGPGDETPYVIDPELIFRPGAHRRLRYVRFPEHGGDVIETRFDAHGFRAGGGDPLAGDAFRVFVYGDSFIQASYSPVRETLAGQLEARLRAESSRPVHVVNAGVDGYGPDQIYLRLAREVPSLRPDLVVVSLFADNDFGDLIRNKLFRLGPGAALERHAFRFEPELLDHQAARQRLGEMWALHRALADPLLLKRDLRILLERRLGVAAPWLAGVPIDSAYRTETDVDWIAVWLRRAEQEFEDFVTRRDPGLRLDNVRSDHYDADLSIHPDRDASRYKRALMEAVLGELVGFLRARATPLLLVIVPSPIDACEGYDWQVDPVRFPDYERRALTRALAQMARRLDVPHVDLFDAFASTDCNALYFHHGNNHWNARGQALAAEQVAARIRAGGLALRP